MPRPKRKDIERRSLAAARDELTRGERDSAGFATGTQPHITKQQFFWLSHRLDAQSDLDACLETHIDLDLVDAWHRDPDFEAIYIESMGNKREAFKHLTTALLPTAMRVIDSLLSSSRENSQVRGLNLLLRAQALLIDKVQTHDPEALATLLAHLRQPRPASSVTILPKELPPVQD